MRMITYHEAKDKPETFRALTGIEPSEFEDLLREFEATYSRDIEKNHQPWRTSKGSWWWT